MPEITDQHPIRDKIHIVLRGPDGKIKDERNTQEEQDVKK